MVKTRLATRAPITGRGFSKGVSAQEDKTTQSTTTRVEGGIHPNSVRSDYYYQPPSDFNAVLYDPDANDDQDNQERLKAVPISEEENRTPSPGSDAGPSAYNADLSNPGFTLFNLPQNRTDDVQL